MLLFLHGGPYRSKLTNQHHMDPYLAITILSLVVLILYRNKYLNSTSMCSYSYNKRARITCMVIGSPIRNMTKHVTPMKISFRYPTRRWWGQKSTTAVTNPSTPTNCQHNNITLRQHYKLYHPEGTSTISDLNACFHNFWFNASLWANISSANYCKVIDVSYNDYATPLF